MNFHEVRFPASLSFGSMGGPERRTEIVTLMNGFEERNTPWAHSRRRYDAGLGVRSLDDLEGVIAFFEERMGRLHGFRWKDWGDFKSCPASKSVAFNDQLIGVSDGAKVDWPLIKTYGTGANAYVRPIAKPVAGTVRIGIDEQELTEGADFTVDHNTGVIRLMHPPRVGAEILAGYEFDVPVRFDTDQIQISIAGFQAGEVPSIPVVEVRL